MSPDIRFWFFITSILIFCYAIGSYSLLYSQYKTLKLIQKENRLFHPRYFLLATLPIIGNVIYVFLVANFSESLKKEFLSRKLIKQNNNPSYKIGMTYALCPICFVISLILMSILRNSINTEAIVIQSFLDVFWFGLFMLFLLLAPISLIIYSRMIARYKKILLKNSTI